MRSTPITDGAQEQRASNSPKQHRIPSPRSPEAIFVGDAHVHLGWIVPAGDSSFFVFDFGGSLIGEYDTKAAAASAVPYIAEIGGEA
jgi:hypothetical protein